MAENAEKRIVHLSRSIAMMRDLTTHLSQAYDYNYGHEVQDRLDRLIGNLDEVVISFDQLRDHLALVMVDERDGATV